MTKQTSTDPIEAILAQLEEPAAPREWELIHQLHSFPSSEEMAFRSAQQLRMRSPVQATARTLEIHKDDKRVVVEYDYESAAGRIQKLRVTFADVLALGYREIAFPIEGELKGAREVRCVAQSSWLSDVVSSWRSSLANGSGVFDMRLRLAFKHYTVFSSGGRVDVVASSCRRI
jgi:hypothetical protein